MIASEIITNFELQISDITELSTSEEYIVMNRVYQRVCSDRAWEFLKTALTGTLLGSGIDGFYITVPTDFSFFYDNYNWTDNSIAVQLNANPRVIYIGTNKAPYQVVNYSDRYKYLGNGGYCYLDLANNRIVFTGIPIATTYFMDYIKFPATLTASDTPVIPNRFQDILVYGMAVENDIVQLSPKAKSYAPENQALYENYLADLALWNAQLTNY